MFGSLISSIGDKKDALEFKLALYIVLGIVAIVVISLLLDSIRRFIRGLDTAALGALLLWIGHKASEIKIISIVSNLLYLIGGTLFAVGLLVFIVLTLFKRRRAKKIVRQAQAQQAQQAQQAEKTE